MEMQEITPEKENAKEDEGASKEVPEVKAKGTRNFEKYMHLIDRDISEKLCKTH